MTATSSRRGVSVIAAVAVAAMVLTACQPAPPPLGRPALKQTPPAPRVFDNADPALLVTPTGLSYLFGSTNNKKLPVRRITSFGTSLADSQTHWARDARDAMPTRPAWVDPTEWQIWAPTVIRLGERYVVFFAAARGGPTSDENNDQCIGRPESSSPTGPYGTTAPSTPPWAVVPSSRTRR